MSLMAYINSEPRGFFLADMGTNGLYLNGQTAYDIYTSPSQQLAMAQMMDRLFPSDFSYSFCDGIIFCETLGLDILKPDKDFPSILNHPITSREILSTYRVPDPYKDGRMPVNLESLELIAKGIDKPLYVSIQGPFTLAVQLAGATHLLRSILKDPEFVEALLAFTTETVKSYALAAEKAGAQLISISEPGAVTLNPQRFDQYVVTAVNKVYKALSCWKSMHICGDTSDILANMLKCDLDAVSLDQIMDYNQVIHKVPDHIVLIGNLDPIDTLARGSTAEIEATTYAMVHGLKDHKNYLCAFGCNCLNDTPVENLQVAMATGRLDHGVLEEGR